MATNEFSVRFAGEMLRGAAEAGPFLRRESTGWEILIYEKIAWKWLLERWSRARRDQECLTGNEAEEFGRHKETHLKERGKSGQHNITQFLGKEFQEGWSP